MKKLAFLLAVLSIICILTSCDSNVEVEGLKFYPQDNGSFYVGADAEKLTTKELIIPAFYEGRPVTGIAENGFSWCDTLTSVNLPLTINVIDDMAFAYCASLESINIPRTTEVIGSSAFIGCKKLESVIIPEGVLEIGREAFSSCEQLKELSLPESLYYVSPTAFLNCDSIEKLTLLGPEIIEKNTFNAPNLTELYVGDKVKEIRSDNQFGNMRLNKIRISSNLELLHPYTINVGYGFEYNYYEGQKYLGNERNPYVVLVASSNNTEAESIVAHEDTRVVVGRGSKTPMSIELNDGIKFINIGIISGYESLNYNTYKGGRYLGTKDNPYYMLYDVDDTDISELEIHPDCRVLRGGIDKCETMVEIYIPKNVYHISPYFFENNSFLSAINVDPQNKHFLSHDGLLYSGTGKTLIRCPMGVRGDVVVKSGVTNIGRNAFYECDFITSIDLQKGVKIIHSYAIDCAKLKEIHLPTSIKEIRARGFNDVSTTITVYYGGAKWQWRRVEVSNNNLAVFVRCSDIWSKLFSQTNA